LVDDHPLWRETLRKVLERQRFARVVGEAGDGAEAVEQASSCHPEVVVMDIQLPRQNGVAATADLVARHPSIKVLVLASSVNRAQVLGALEAGAAGYLLKTASSEDVREAVRRVHSGELVFPAAVADVVLVELRHRPDPPPTVGDPTVSSSSFRREGDYWTISFDGDVLRLRDTRGVRYLATLVHNPGREFHSIDLVTDGKEGRLISDRGAGPALDTSAKRAYTERLHDLQADLDEAEGWRDLERAARARAEMDALAHELHAAYGRDGRPRQIGSATERARVNATVAIKATLKKMAEHLPSLAEHLSTTVRTGTYCSYTPDPRAPIDWH